MTLDAEPPTLPPDTESQWIQRKAGGSNGSVLAAQQGARGSVWKALGVGGWNATSLAGLSEAESAETEAMLRAGARHAASHPHAAGLL